LLLQYDNLVTALFITAHSDDLDLSVGRHEQFAVVGKAQHDRRFVAGANIVASGHFLCTIDTLPFIAFRRLDFDGALIGNDISRSAVSRARPRLKQ